VNDKAIAVSVLITNWNGMDVLRPCLRSVRERTQDIACEVIVVDDASTDGSAEALRTEFPWVRLIVRPVNGGFVKANNEGVRAARGRNVLLLNSDTELLNNAVKILSDYLDAHDGVGICGGWLKNTDGSSQVSYGFAPSLTQALADAFFLNDLFPSAGFPNRGVAPAQGRRTPFRVEYVTGADLMIRRSLVASFGLFDELYEAYCEEVDLCRRVRVAGGQEVHFVPEAQILHLGGYSYGKRGKRHVQLLHGSYGKFLVKHHGPAYAVAVRTLFAWHYAVKGAVRGIRFLAAPAAQREARAGDVRAAWYHVLYSLFPAGRSPDR
jgi:GT2 family glycosyltransferase